MTENENKYICPICGEIVNIEDNEYMFHDDEYYHQECFDDNFTYCEDCQEYYPNEDVAYLENYDRYVCGNCLDSNYNRCHECDEYVHDDDTHWGCDDRPYCEDCYCDIFISCDECGNTIYRDDAYFDEDGYAYCEYCYNKKFNGTIKSYHDSSVEYLPMYLNDEDRNINHGELYGLELEITGDRDTAERFQEIMGDTVVLMRDGSVDGYEMVSMPLSKEFFYNKFVPLLDEGLKYLRDNGMTGHNGGGIHIHFKQFESGMQVANATQILYGSDNDLIVWRMINQRRKSNMSWCSQSNPWHDPQEILNEDLLYPCGDSNHGTALNYDYRTETHELRIFNSNLRLERVIKNMECLFALQDYVRANTQLICDTKGFIKFIAENSNKYPYLVDFMDEKNIFITASQFYEDNYMYSLPLRIKENFIDEDNEDIGFKNEINEAIEEALQ